MEEQLKFGLYTIHFYTKPVRYGRIIGFLFRYDFGSFLHIGGFYFFGLYIALTKSTKYGTH